MLDLEQRVAGGSKRVVDAVQIVGALLVLIAFVLGQFALLASGAWSYLAANAIGGGLLTATAIIGGEWGFVLLEGCWTLVSCYGLAQKLRGAAPPAGV